MVRLKYSQERNACCAERKHFGGAILSGSSGMIEDFIAINLVRVSVQ